MEEDEEDEEGDGDEDVELERFAISLLLFHQSKDEVKEHQH